MEKPFSPEDVEGRAATPDTDGRAAEEEGVGRTPAGGVRFPADRKGRTRRGRHREAWETR